MKLTLLYDRIGWEEKALEKKAEAKQICKLHNIPTPRFFLAKDVDEALKYGEALGYPLAAKIVSPDITHKSDVGGVVLNIKSRGELQRAYQQLIENASKHAPHARVLGVLVEEMVLGGVELAVGMVRDQTFGPTVMFGLGGVFIEVLRDVSFRVAPLSEDDAREMIGEVRGSRLLEGYRNYPPVDVERLKRILLTISQLSLTYPEFSQIDFNPIIAYGSSLWVVDARIFLTNP